MLHINYSLLKQELKDNQVVALFNSTKTDAEGRMIYFTVDSDLPLKGQQLPPRWSDLIPVDSIKADEILQQTINGEAVIRYLVILGNDKDPFEVVLKPQIKPICHGE